MRNKIDTADRKPKEPLESPVPGPVNSQRQPETSCAQASGGQPNTGELGVRKGYARKHVWIVEMNETKWHGRKKDTEPRDFCPRQSLQPVAAEHRLFSES